MKTAKVDFRYFLKPRDSTEFVHESMDFFEFFLESRALRFRGVDDSLAYNQEYYREMLLQKERIVHHNQVLSKFSETP
jgi:hypothetical protein